VNPLTVLPFFAFAVLATWWPGLVDGARRGRTLLQVEVVVLGAWAVGGHLLGRLVEPRPAGVWWGRVAFTVAIYLYVCGRGATLVRAVLDLPDLHMRRDDDRTTGAVEVARGRIIGVLERALAVTLVALGQFGALGLVVGAKSLARMKALEDRDFAEYFLIGTLASLLLALAGGLALRALP
jgi:hypothetical protein